MSEKELAMTDNKELKPCPFCGGEGEAGIAYNADTGQTEYWITCRGNNCKIYPQTAVYKTKKSAIAAWNRRAE